MVVPETKLKVLKSAAELISARGYYHVSVREICESAGVTKPVIYYYFKDKEDVLAELIKEGHSRFLELIEKFIRPQDSFETNLKGLLKVYIRYAETYPYLIRISIHVQLFPLPANIKNLSSQKSLEVMGLINTIFKKGVEEKILDKHASPEMFALSLTAPLGIFVVESIFHQDSMQLFKSNFKKYFNFWKSQFFKERRSRE